MQRLNDASNNSPIDILPALKSGKVVWICAFPTMGKTTFQRVLRFLPAALRDSAGLDSVVDATDTDEWLATFKMGDNMERKDEIHANVTADMKLADSLSSHHPRLVVTNMWDCVSKAGIEPTAIIIPSSADIVVERVRKRGDDHPERIADSAKEWLQHVLNADWVKDRSSKTIILNAGEYVADALSFGDHTLSGLEFNRSQAVRLRNAPSNEEQPESGATFNTRDPDADSADQLIVEAVETSASHMESGSFDTDENPDETDYIGSF